MTVAQNVGFGLKIRKRPKKEIAAKVEELLALVHLPQFANRLPSQLSGGQRQRMALARALAIEPTVLLLDEPFGALDAKVRKELRTWLRRLHDEVHVTTVFVTHDQEEALEVADQIVVINDGAIEQVGSPDDLYDRPASEFVMSFLGPVTTAGRPTDPAARPGCADRPVPRRLRGPDRRSQPGRVRGAAGHRAGRRAAARSGPCHPDPRGGRRQAARQRGPGLAQTGARRVADPDHVRRRPESGSGAAAAGLVRIRASTEYALQTVMHLAVADAGKSTTRQIAAGQDIPPRFLTQVIAQLRRAGILAGRRGGSGWPSRPTC